MSEYPNVATLDLGAAKIVVMWILLTVSFDINTSLKCYLSVGNRNWQRLKEEQPSLDEEERWEAMDLFGLGISTPNHIHEMETYTK